jgi:hypothetical protein
MTEGGIAEGLKRAIVIGGTATWRIQRRDRKFYIGRPWDITPLAVLLTADGGTAPSPPQTRKWQDRTARATPSLIGRYSGRVSFN